MGKPRHYLAAISAYIIWGMFSLVLRPIKDHAPIDILYYRIVCCLALAFFVLILFRKESVRDSRDQFRALPPGQRVRLVGWNLLAGVLLTANWFLFIYVMNYVSVKATSLAYLVCPILTALLAFLLLKEPMKKVQWVALAMGVTGCIILAFGHLYDLVLAVLVGFSYALYLILQRKNKGYDRLLVLFVHILISVVGMTPYYFATAASAPVDTSFYLFVLAIAVFFTLVPMLLNLFALSGIRSGTVGMLMNINPIIAFSLSVFYFGEKADAMQYLGYGIIFGSVVVFNWKIESRKVEKSEKTRRPSV